MIPKSKKIAVIHPNVDKKWWAVNMMILLWNLLKERWNQVELFTTSYDKDLFWKDISFKVNIFSKIKISYKIRKFDYIFIWNSPMQFVWAISKMLFLSQAKIFWWHHHYPWYYEKNTNTFILFKRILEKFSLKWIDGLIANSYYIKNSLKKIYSLDSKILYPVLDTYFENQKHIENTFSNFTIISYGRWVKWKNLKQIFETYLELKSKIPKLELLIWWVGEELDFFRKQYSTDKHIRFLWLLDKKDIVDNLSISNVFLFPSKIDSFGLSSLEALSLWIPVVWFSWKWLSEIIKNGKNWFLVDSKIEFTEKTFKILNNKNLNKQLSRNCIKTIHKFTIKTFEKNLEKLF